MTPAIITNYDKESGVYTLYFAGIEPKACQSVRTGRGSFYQPKEVVDWKNSISYLAKRGMMQLTNGEPVTGAIEVTRLVYLMHTPQKLTKLQERLFLEFKSLNHSSRPDLEDNLSKGFFDALKGICFGDDSKVCTMRNVEKRYSPEPGILISFRQAEAFSRFPDIVIERLKTYYQWIKAKIRS
jgi:Holliday junction resolvase RusA-like endonuclease